MNILDDIVRDKRDELRRRQQAMPLTALEARCRHLPPPRDFEEALRPRVPGVRLIAEVKKASPSRGVLAATLDPVAIATTYARHGADAISVLTDEKYFRGHLDLLAAIRAGVSVPLLRKDFTLAEYQLWESRAAGADAILLIVSILEPPELRDLLQAAKGVGLAALVECHTAGELETALAVGARIVGINNRDLTTFDTRIETTLDLLPRIPPGPIVVSESGFFTGDDVKRVASAGAHAVLVGEALVTASDVPGKIRELREALTAGAVDASSHLGQTGGEMGPAPAPSAGAVDASSHLGQTGGEMGPAPAPSAGAVDASSHLGQTGGEMGPAPAPSAGAVDASSHLGQTGGEMGPAPAPSAGAVDASSHLGQTGGEMGPAPAPSAGAVDASSHLGQTGGEMGGAPRPPHSS